MHGVWGGGGARILLSRFMKTNHPESLAGKTCGNCATTFFKKSRESWKQYYKKRFCSLRCKAIVMQPKTFTHWKGGRSLLKTGYIYVHCPKHPFATKHGYVMEHRLVMESQIGRCLRPDEDVHHINEIKDDNHIDNLELLSKSDHTRLHAIKNRLGKDSKEYRMRNIFGQFTPQIS